jgi:hypothetical protein
MKAQHRHELEANVLAGWLEDKLEQIKPYTQAIIGAVIALFVVFGVWYYLRHMDTSAEQAASDQLVAALNDRLDPLKALQDTIETHPGTQQAVLARLLRGEELLRSGSEQLYTNKAEGKKNLTNAAAEFREVEQSANDTMIKAWALHGMARAKESLGELDRAREDYERLIKDFPGSALKDDAQRHLTNLNRDSTKKFYDWFAKQDPSPTSMDQLPGRPGQKPIFDLSDPTMPQSDIKLPSAFDGKSTPSTTPSGPPDATTTPPGGESTSPPLNPPAQPTPDTTTPPATTPPAEPAK